MVQKQNSQLAKGSRWSADIIYRILRISLLCVSGTVIDVTK